MYEHSDSVEFSEIRCQLHEKQKYSSRPLWLWWATVPIWAAWCLQLSGLHAPNSGKISRLWPTHAIHSSFFKAEDDIYACQLLQNCRERRKSAHWGSRFITNGTKTICKGTRPSAQLRDSSQDPILEANINSLWCLWHSLYPPRWYDINPQVTVMFLSRIGWQLCCTSPSSNVFQHKSRSWTSLFCPVSCFPLKACSRQIGTHPCRKIKLRD